VPAFHDPERLPPPSSVRRTESYPSASATNVKVEHTRWRPVAPRTSVLSAGADHRRSSGRQSTGYPAGSRAPALPVAPTRPSFVHEAREACSESEAGTLVGRRGGRLPGEALTYRAPLGSPSTCRANGEAVERTRVPSRRSEPRLLTEALRWLQRSRTKASIFHTHGGVTLDGVHRRARGREAVPVAQHATGTTCLRRPNDVLRNVSPASRCAASFEFTLATRTVTIKPKTSVKRTFFVHRMFRVFRTRCSHLVCSLFGLRTSTHQDLHSLLALRQARGLLVFTHSLQKWPHKAPRK
jgi:hypothetical protein